MKKRKRKYPTIVFNTPTNRNLMNLFSIFQRSLIGENTIFLNINHIKLCKSTINFVIFVVYFEDSFMKKPLILITNDDSINAGGIKLLASLMRQIGRVLIVAPSMPQSAKSNSITIEEPLRYWHIEHSQDYDAYITNGTPVDCMKVAFNMILKEEKPDLVVAGINHGSNASVNTIYSGTMAAVFEGCQEGVPSIGFSVDNHDLRADFSYCSQYILDISNEILLNGIEPDTCLNVNFPQGQIKGVRVCHQAKALWNEQFIERTDPLNQKYYWLTGVYKCLDSSERGDYMALEKGYCAITPMQLDYTAYGAMEKYRSRFEK